MSGPNYAGERGVAGTPGKEYATQNIELYAKDEEIARLKTQHEEMLLKHAREQNVCLELLETAFDEIERLKTEGQKDYEDMRSFQAKFIEADHEKADLKALALRAADAVDPRITICLNYSQACEFSDELRKAAQ